MSGVRDVWANRELRNWVAEFVTTESQSEATERWVNQVHGRIVDQVGQVRQDPAVQNVIRDACEAHWRAFLANLGQPVQTFHLVEEARLVPIVAAQHGYPLTVIFDIYTSGEQAVWEFITNAVRERPSDAVDEADALVHFWTRSSTWFDHSVQQSVALFQAEVERIRQGDAARRLEVVRAVLGGTLRDPREASARLGGHPLSAYQTAILLHTRDDAMIADLPQAAQVMTTALGLRQPLVVHPGGRDLWAWISSTGEPDLTLLAECGAWLEDHHILAAVGSSSPGIDGFRSSHSEALAAQRVSLVGNGSGSGPVTYFADVELLTLVGSGEEMRRFVHRTLGRLSATDEQVARLRATLRALLSSGSVDVAAKRLLVHKNTVRYRIERAEELMGRRLSDSPTEIDVALRCYDTYLMSGAAAVEQPEG